jgi:hypothetical protein
MDVMLTFLQMERKPGKLEEELRVQNKGLSLILPRAFRAPCF